MSQTALPRATTTAQGLSGDAELVDPLTVARELGVEPAVGLSSQEARRRLIASGPNDLDQQPGEPWWRKLVRQFTDPLVVLLLVAIVVSLVAWWAEGAPGLPVDALVIAAIVVINAGVGLLQERRVEDAVAALADLTTASSTVLRDGRLTTVTSRDLVVGDVLVLTEGDAVGADARLLEAVGLRVQEASLTGESAAVVKDPATLAAPAALGDRVNLVFRGTGVVQGVGRAVVIATGMDTQVGAIAAMLEATATERSPLRKEIAEVGRLLGILVVVIALVVMVTLVVLNDVRTLDDLVPVALLGVSLAVAAVPEGLPAILSLVLAVGVQALAKRQAVMKDLHSVETLGAATVICSDKTGTLTRNEMTLVRVATASGTVSLTGTGYRPEGGVLGEPSADALLEAGLVLVGGSVANDARLQGDDEAGAWEIHGDPTDAAFLVALRKVRGATERVDSFERCGEVPFTSERKLMSVLSRDLARGGHRLFTKGAPDVLLERCSFRRLGDDVEPLDEDGRAAVARTIAELAEQGFRTLGVAYRTIDSDASALGDLDGSAESDLVLLGVVGIIDPPRPEAAAAVAEAHRAGIRTVMITGDHPATARRIATDLGILGPVYDPAAVVTGTDLDALSDAELRRSSREAAVYARVSPRHKLRIVDALQADRHVVAMTGDGVNDAPALKSSDIGVAMGITGTEVTKQAATLILADDNYATIVAAVRQGRGIYDNIRKFLRYLLSSNLGEVVTVFFGVVLTGAIGLTTEGTTVVLPLLATQILWINLVTDSGPALAMGVDPEDGDVMARPPRPLDARILDRAMWGRVVFGGFVMGAVTLMAIDLHLPGGLLPGDDSLDVARTVGFTTLVLAQLFNALNARSDRASAFRRPFRNRWLWGSIVLAVVLQVAVVEVPLLQAAFGTVSLGWLHWAQATGLASVVLWADEALKAVLRALDGRRARPAAALPGQR